MVKYCSQVAAGLNWAWLISTPVNIRRYSSEHRTQLILWYWLWITELSFYIWSKYNQSSNFYTVSLCENQLFMSKLQTKLNRNTGDPPDGCLCSWWGRKCQCSSVKSTSQHGLLLLGSADEPADAFDHLTLRLHLLVFALFWQEHDWQKGTTERRTLGVNEGFRISLLSED